MTNEQMTRAITNLTDRMNRAEANAAHNKPVVAGCSLQTAIDAAIGLLEAAIEGQTTGWSAVNRNSLAEVIKTRLVNGR
ncbi:hypothetical protein [Blastomonas sp.]|uniref:hypothetical protein n=1 Tax=Blastomonas sp. TaxID=1909299 RepID=UPI00262701FB|nr:hypothetical protein [Blastomonas sp.]MDM7957760.1 hypothetical protein [Blastomonas sp.]